MWAFFSFQKIGTDSVHQADFGDIKILIQFPGKSILKFLLGFWKCVGDNKTRGCYILEVTQCVYLFTSVIFVCNIRGTYLIFPQPTQFQPPLFQIFGRFFIQNHVSSTALQNDIGIKRCGIFSRIFWYIWKVCRILSQTPMQKLKSGFLTSSSQGIASSLVLFEMIFEALQSELFRFKFHAPSLKILKIPEFNLLISKTHEFLIKSKSKKLNNFKLSLMSNWKLFDFWKKKMINSKRK